MQRISQMNKKKDNAIASSKFAVPLLRSSSSSDIPRDMGPSPTVAAAIGPILDIPPTRQHLRIPGPAAASAIAQARCAPFEQLGFWEA